MLILLAFRIQPEGFWLSVLLPAGETALVATPTCNPTLALWHFGTLALWHFGTVIAMLTLLAFRIQSEGF